MLHQHTTITQIQSPPRPHRRARTQARVQIVAAAAAVLLALTSCTGTDAEADPTPAQSSSIPATTVAPTTAAPTPTAEPVYQPATENGPAQNVPVPVLPEKAKEFSKEGLIAFAEYWYSTLGYAFETGDPEPMMAVTGPDCLPCESMRKMVVSGHEHGKWITGGKMVLGTPSTSFVMTPEGTYQVTVMARQEQVKYFDANKKLITDLGVGRAAGDILVGVHQEGQWLALTVGHLAGSKAK